MEHTELKNTSFTNGFFTDSYWDKVETENKAWIEKMQQHIDPTAKRINLSDINLGDDDNEMEILNCY